MSESKDWVTVKIVEEVRDEAKEDPRTYTEIMQAGLGKNPNGNAEELIEELKNELSMANDASVDMDVERLFNRLDDLETSIPSKTVEELEARQ